MRDVAQERNISSESILWEVHELPAAIRGTFKETYSSAIGVASAIRERSPRRVYFIGSGTSSYSPLAASYAACVVASPDEVSVLATSIQVHIRDRYLLTPLLTPPRALHAETSGNHQQGNRLR